MRPRKEAPPVLDESQTPSSGNRKWRVCVYGQIPSEIEIMAKDRETAEAAAVDIVLECVEFHGHLDE